MEKREIERAARDCVVRKSNIKTFESSSRKHFSDAIDTKTASAREWFASISDSVVYGLLHCGTQW